MRTSRWGALAGGACVAALGLGGWLAWEDAHRGPDETVPQSEHVLPEATAAAAASVSPAPPEAARASQQHYLSGVIYFQKADYEKARDEWSLSARLDPSNAEAKAGLARLESLYGLKAKP